MKALHRLSGIVITIFILAHLLNHAYIYVGPAAHLAFMERLRIVYRHPLVEVPLLLAVCFQIYSGIQMVWHGRRINWRGLDRIQRWSGAYLASFFLIHLSAVLAGRWILDLDTNFYFGAAGLNTFPLFLFFIPYYALAIVAFFGHLGAVHGKKMTGKIIGISPQGQGYSILALGVIIAGATIFGLTNGFRWFAIPEAYWLFGIE
ncbi:hypothetical protein [Lewinella sp. 4G2]|uniref:hypothetical protein n=1 Tax=Lewinella sp. 4G2 TaxID=1803372 RepID=UPI0007B46671|nr:hypothetical protein [Lewinella sp. 4G2]OAV45176.1 hypothetical protein A3850_012035 [Lewinella sp. 4G2]